MDVAGFAERLERMSRGRKLLAYHCSGSDTLLGAANVGASIFILLLLGFVTGFAVSWLVWWRREKRRDKLEMEYRHRFGEAGRHDVPDVNDWIKAANTPTIKSPTSGAGARPSATSNSFAAPPPELQMPKLHPTVSGPLGLGVSKSLKGESVPQGLRGGAGAGAGVGGPAAGLGAQASGNPFADVAPYNVLHNPVSSLNNSPLPPAKCAPSQARSEEVDQRGGLIGALYRPASDPASPQPSMGPAPTDGAVHISDASWTVRPQGADASVSSDYAAALGGAADGGPTDITNQASNHTTGRGDAYHPTKVAQKSELLQQVREQEYLMDELDPEWQELLEELNSHLRAQGLAALNGKETAVAIRSLIVSTASQSADVAIKNAMLDIQSYRRMQGTVS